MDEPQKNTSLLAGATSQQNPVLQRRNRPRELFSPAYQIMIASLRTEIEATGLQRVEIAKKLGKPKSYLSKILRGNQVAALTEVRAICHAAGIPFVEWVAEVDQLIRVETQE